MLKHDARFINSLVSKESFDVYVHYTVPARRALSDAEKKRQAFKGNVKKNKVAYKVFNPPVKLLRKANRLLTKILS